MTAPSAAPMTVEELAAASGVTVRNVRAYNTAGLLPPPQLQGRLGLYGDEHLQRLDLIRALRDQGFGLPAIRRIFERAPDSSWRELTAVARSVSSNLFAHETPVQMKSAELVAKWRGQMTPALLARAVRAGLLRELPDGRVEVLSPALGQVGEQLAALGLPLAQVLDMQEAMIRSLRRIAAHWIETLAEHLLASAPRGGELAPLLEQARPLAVGAVQAAFPVILQQALDRRIGGSRRTHPAPAPRASRPARTVRPRKAAP